MPKSLHNALSNDTIQRAESRFIEEAKAGRDESAWEELGPLLRSQSHQEEAALAVVRLVEGGYFSREQALEVLEQVWAAHQENERVLGLLGDALEQARDIDMLNAPPPDSPLFGTVADKLASLASRARGTEHEKVLLSGLATAARMMARQRDALAERSYVRLLELEPDKVIDTTTTDYSSKHEADFAKACWRISVHRACRRSRARLTNGISGSVRRARRRALLRWKFGSAWSRRSRWAASAYQKDVTRSVK
jgi:hypothetical protein